MLVVVVFPCVPVTTSRSRSTRNSSWINCAIEFIGIRSSSTRSNSGLPREIAFPTTTRSGRGSRFSARYGSITAIPIAASWSLIGGYAASIRPRHLVPLGLQHPRKRRHRRPTNPNQMNPLPHPVALLRFPSLLLHRCLCSRRHCCHPRRKPALSISGATSRTKPPTLNSAFCPQTKTPSSPRVNVRFPPVTCPHRNPIATGPSNPRNACRQAPSRTPSHAPPHWQTYPLTPRQSPAPSTPQSADAAACGPTGTASLRYPPKTAHKAHPLAWPKASPNRPRQSPDTPQASARMPAPGATPASHHPPQNCASPPQPPPPTTANPPRPPATNPQPPSAHKTSPTHTASKTTYAAKCDPSTRQTPWDSRAPAPHPADGSNSADPHPPRVQNTPSIDRSANAACRSATRSSAVPA